MSTSKNRIYVGAQSRIILAVTGGGSICECGRLSQSSWLSEALNIVILSYLLTALSG